MKSNFNSEIVKHVHHREFIYCTNIRLIYNVFLNTYIYIFYSYKKNKVTSLTYTVQIFNLNVCLLITEDLSVSPLCNLFFYFIFLSLLAIQQKRFELSFCKITTIQCPRDVQICGHWQPHSCLRKYFHTQGQPSHIGLKGLSCCEPVESSI